MGGTIAQSLFRLATPSGHPQPLRPMPKKEAQARIRINKLLEQAAWRFFPDKNGPDNIICESRITKTVYSPSFDLGNDFESPPTVSWIICS